ncbi:hypothetical protein D3C83_212590 [compost metagenome]
MSMRELDDDDDVEEEKEKVKRRKFRKVKGRSTFLTPQNIDCIPKDGIEILTLKK